MNNEENYKVAQQYYEIAKEQNNQLAIEILENHFPELKESEDEKIRKSLIKSYTNQHSSNFPTIDGFTREQILAWLEKQGEQKSFDKCEGCNNVKGCVTCVNGDQWMHISEPTEWSEEDEKMRTKCAACLGCNYHGGLMPRDEYDKAHNWLGSLKNRVQPQSKQDWNEDDEVCYNSIIEHLKYSITNGKPETYRSGRLTDWLNTIKDRYTWTPNDEQMEALLYEVNAWDKNSINGLNLKSLYQDLKKLKGE